MQILFFTHYFPPEGNAPASRTYEHCKRWVAQGHQVTVITSFPNAPDGVIYPGWKNRICPQREQVDGIEVIRVWTYLAANAGNTRRVINYVSYLFSAVFVALFWTGRPRVIVATSPQFFCGWAGVFASWLKWSPLVLEIRDIWPDSIVTVGAMRKGWAISLLEVLEKWMYRSAKLIVVVTQGLKEDIQRKVPHLRQIHVVTNGVDLDRFPLVVDDPQTLQQWPIGDRFVCAYVGTIGMAHGLQVVLQAAKLLREQHRDDIVFLIVGDGAERATLKELADQWELSDRVIFTGKIAKEQVPSVLLLADSLLIHLKKNKLFESAIPSKIFEAMAMNKPLLVGVRGEVAAIIERAECGLMFEPENAKELVGQLKKLVDDPEFRIKMERTGRKFVAENYSRDALATDMLDSIENCLTPGIRPA